MATLLPCGQRAFLVELPSLDAVLALDHRVRVALADDSLSGGDLAARVEDVVPAARTLLVSVRQPDSLASVRKAVAALADGLTDAEIHPAPPDADAPVADVVDIPVRYDGPDLAEVASLTGLTPDEVVAAHTGTPWRVGFGGFAPGFAYLVDGDPRLEVARKKEPRTSVPAGSVGLAGQYSGIYPRPSPGGWQLIGTTDVVLWDVDRDPPALLQPGAWVRFVAVEAGSEPAASATPAAAGSDGATRLHGGDPDARPCLEVLKPGPLTLVQDPGRAGWKHVGVGHAGAADLGAHRLANRLVGNAEDAATLEVTFGGLSVRALRSVVVVVTGAHAVAAVNGRAREHATHIHLTEGDVLTLAIPSVGLRSYVAVAGGFAAPMTLGSRSADTMARLGPDRLAVGDVLSSGPSSAIPVLHGYASMAAPQGGVVEVEVVPGPRAEWTGGLTDLVKGEWSVSPQCDRVGVRLVGTPLTRAPEYQGRELPSEGVMRGAIQVPANGLPVLFLNDHPVTGGYPVIGVLTEASSDRIAQARPGQAIKFKVVAGSQASPAAQPQATDPGVSKVRTVRRPEDPGALDPKAARALFRAGLSVPTTGWSAGYAQANLITVPKEYAFNFLLFAQRNPKPCPILDVLEAGQVGGGILDGDIRTDLPGYRVYRDGVLEAEVTDVTDYWSDDLVSFLIGCSFTFEHPLIEAGIAMRHIDAGRNVPMYVTNTRCRGAGRLTGPLVVSLRGIPPHRVADAVRITSRFPSVHGAPVHVGDPGSLGIADLSRPDFGEPPVLEPGDVPVFWACGVTPQAMVMEARPPLAITHAPGYMLITDARDSEYQVP